MKLIIESREIPEDCLPKKATQSSEQGVISILSERSNENATTKSSSTNSTQ